MSLIFDLLELFSSFSLTKKVTEDDITENINYLKKQSWFQEYLENDRFRHVIIYDQKVRDFIGKLKTSKLKKDRYVYKTEHKLHKLLIEKTIKPT